MTHPLTLHTEADEQQSPEPVFAATDGSTRPGNPGHGGWAWITADGESGAGSEPWTTNNRMELTAILELLRSADPSRPLLVACDSTYAIGAVTRWPERPRRSRENAANPDLIEAICSEIEGRAAPVLIHWVRGHDGHPLNELADSLAYRAADMEETDAT